MGMQQEKDYFRLFLTNFFRSQPYSALRIDSIVKKFRSLIVCNVYTFSTIQSVLAAQQLCTFRYVLRSHPIVCKILSYHYLYSITRGYGDTTRETLFSSVLDQFSSALNRISPSEIDSIVKKYQSVIVRNVCNFGTIQSVPAAQTLCTFRYVLVNVLYCRFSFMGQLHFYLIFERGLSPFSVL